MQSIRTDGHAPFHSKVQAPHHADLQVNLLPKGERSAQSHDIAKRVRPGVQAVAAKYGARAKVAEVPPGPPVLQTLVAEVS